MAKLKALQCSTFISVLHLLDAYVGSEIEGKILIAAWKGSGYTPIPKGGRFFLKSREEDEMVTVLEIETGLNHLGFDVKAFIDMVDRIEVPPLPKRKGISLNANKDK